MALIIKGAGCWVPGAEKIGSIRFGTRHPAPGTLFSLAFAKKLSDTTAAPPCDDHQASCRALLRAKVSAPIVGFRQLEGEQKPGFCLSFDDTRQSATA